MISPQFSCYKLSGAGNTFVFVDLRPSGALKALAERFGKKSRAAIARELCDTHFSIGADGLLFLENSKAADAKWDFFNADGSRADMCGNAARCVGLFLHIVRADSSPMLTTLVPTPQSYNLETRKGNLLLTVKEVAMATTCIAMARVEVEMPLVRQYKKSFFIKNGKNKLSFDFVDSGVPHAVVPLRTKLSQVQLQSDFTQLQLIANKIASLPRFAKSGTNVTFYSEQKNGVLCSLTFERGVNGFTQACGTGAVAASVSYTDNTEKLTKVILPGGIVTVDLSSVRPLLDGPAALLAKVFL